MNLLSKGIEEIKAQEKYEDEPFSESWARLEQHLLVEINPISTSAVKDPVMELKKMKTIAETDKELVPKWSTVVAIASKVNEPLEERKNKEKEATKLVRRLEKDRQERERIRRLRAEENMLRV